MGLRMSCGFKVKKSDEQPDQMRIAKNIGNKLSFSASDPRTFRCDVWICPIAERTEMSTFFFRSNARTLSTSPLANAVATNCSDVRARKAALSDSLTLRMYTSTAAIWSLRKNALYTLATNPTSCNQQCVSARLCNH